jgi:hypothetical protein
MGLDIHQIQGTVALVCQSHRFQQGIAFGGSWGIFVTNVAIVSLDTRGSRSCSSSCCIQDAGIGDAGGVAFRGAKRAFVTDVANFFHGSGIRKALFNILEEDLLFDKIFSLISLLAKIAFNCLGDRQAPSQFLSRKDF